MIEDREKLGYHVQRCDRHFPTSRPLVTTIPLFPQIGPLQPTIQQYPQSNRSTLQFNFTMSLSYPWSMLADLEDSSLEIVIGGKNHCPLLILHLISSHFTSNDHPTAGTGTIDAKTDTMTPPVSETSTPTTNETVVEAVRLNTYVAITSSNVQPCTSSDKDGPLTVGSTGAGWLTSTCHVARVLNASLDLSAILGSPDTFYDDSLCLFSTFCSCCCAGNRCVL